MTEEIVQLLKNWKLSENEAIIYVTIIMMGAGCARDIHEITHIPRGKVYQALSHLVEKELINSLEGNPVRYWAPDIRSTFEKIKRETLVSLNEITDRLEKIEQDVATRNNPLSMMKSIWAIEKQTHALFRRVKKEIVILCNNPAWYHHYHLVIRELEKKVSLYLVVRHPQEYQLAKTRLYQGDVLIWNTFHCPEYIPDSHYELECEIFADTHEHMILFKKEEEQVGYFSSKFFLTSYMIRTITDRIEPVQKKKKIRKEEGNNINN